MPTPFQEQQGIMPADAPVNVPGNGSLEQNSSTKEASPYSQFTQPQQVEKAATDILGDTGVAPQERLNRLEQMFQTVPKALLQGMQLEAVTSFLQGLSKTLLSRPIDQAKARMETFLRSPELLNDPSFSPEKKLEITQLIQNLGDTINKQGKELKGPLSLLQKAQNDPMAVYNSWQPEAVTAQKGLISHLPGKNLVSFLTQMSKTALETQSLMQTLEKELGNIPRVVEKVHQEHDDESAEKLLAQLASVPEIPVKELQNIPLIT